MSTSNSENGTFGIYYLLGAVCMVWIEPSIIDPPMWRTATLNAPRRCYTHTVQVINAARQQRRKELRIR